MVRPIVCESAADDKRYDICTTRLVPSLSPGREGAYCFQTRAANVFRFRFVGRGRNFGFGPRRLDETATFDS